jgi:DNA-binding transcriptional ArsR family regulator/prophage maintenance system killer protein
MNELDPVWRVLGDPTRRRMLESLRRGARTTGELCDDIPGMSRHGVIKHLKLLQAAGLVRVERRGRVCLNNLVPGPLARIRTGWLTEFDRPCRGTSESFDGYPPMVDDAIPWTDIQPAPEVGGDVSVLLGRVDDLRDLWEETHRAASPDQVDQVRERTLRRHAVETGILDRFYGLSRRVTELLITEGITLRTAEREGEPSDDVLQIILAQYEALERLSRSALEGEPLGLSDVLALHDLLMWRSVPDLGSATGPRRGSPELPESAAPQAPQRSDVVWRSSPDHAVCQDGTRVALAPPGQVRSATERLLEIDGQSEGTHPIVRAAWFHHQFLSVSPFADGNARTARALALSFLLRAGYAPLVVDRRQREIYRDALDAAHQGDLRPLVLLFARSQEIGLRSELVRPERLAGTEAMDIARACVERMRSLKDRADSARNNRVRTLASLLQVRLVDHFEQMRRDLHDTFTQIDHSTRIWLHRAAPPEERASWWKSELVRTAREGDFWANLDEGSWWTQLEITVFAQTLNYVVAVQRAGRGQTGVLVVTAFAELRVPVYGRDGVTPGDPVPLIRSEPEDSITLLDGDDPAVRWPEVRDLVERTLAAAMTRFGAGLS